jgi:ribosomal protein S18 acetylase RimI-like enzyme
VSIQLRSYKPEDFDTLWALDQVCYDEEVAYSKGELHAYLSFPDSDCVVATFDEGGAGSHAEIAGFCVSRHQGETGYIVTIDVLDKFRRAKVGSALIDETEKRLRAFGVKLIALETAVDDPAAVGFWRKHGYVERGIKKGYYPNNRDAYAMTKTLDPAFREAAAAKRARNKTTKSH